MPKASSKKRKIEPFWFVIDCPEDASVCLVSESHVIYGDDLTKGDAVKFFMSLKSNELSGRVMDFSRK